jgi:hypothetical protein
MTSGTRGKQRILKKYEDNEIWKKILIATYDTRITYNVSSPSSLEFNESPIEDDFFESLKKLSTREVSGKAAKELAFEMSEKYGEIFRLVLNRSIKAGISSTTINKVYSGLITVFKSMKGQDVPIEEFPVKSSIKFDGVKVFAFVRPEGITLTSSSGAEFILSSLIDEMSEATYGVYEGELTSKEGKQVNRTSISGQLNSLLAGTKTDLEEYKYNIYDYIPLDEWDAKVGVSTFLERQQMLAESFNFGIQDSLHVKQVDHEVHVSIEDVEQYFDKLISNGYEGSIHRYDDDVYEWKRVPRLIKKKTIKECVLNCTSVIPHSNPVKGNVGSLCCSGTIHDKDVGDVFIEVHVGSGLSKFDIQRSEEYFIGEKIEVLYNTVIESNGKYSLFLPRFKRVASC